MVYCTADLHFGHANVIQMERRPFQTVEEMDGVLIRNWNARVRPSDEVYLLGDLTLRGPQYAQEILRQLNGRKYLVRGNHDQFVDRASFDRSLFCWIGAYRELRCQGRKVVLFHYPIAEWDQFHRGALHLHGHQHNPPAYNRENAARGLLRYDVGVDANGMAPVSLEEILSFFGLPAGGGDGG